MLHYNLRKVKEDDFWASKISLVAILEIGLFIMRLRTRKIVASNASGKQIEDGEEIIQCEYVSVLYELVVRTISDGFIGPMCASCTVFVRKNIIKIPMLVVLLFIS